MARNGKSRLSKRVARIERLAKPETKFALSSSGFSAVGSTLGTLIKPQTLGQGTERFQRIGDRVKSIAVRMDAVITKVGGLNPASNVRVLCLKAKFSNPSTADMPPAWFSPVNLNKFKVLYDKMVPLKADNVSSGGQYIGGTTRRIRLNIKTHLHKLQYQSSSDTTPEEGEVVFYMLADNIDPEVAYNWQHYYYDQ
jgi:hypothetical protein